MYKEKRRRASETTKVHARAALFVLAPPSIMQRTNVRVYNPKTKVCALIFFDSANLGMQKPMNSFAAAPLFLPEDSIFRIRLCIYHFRHVTKTFCLRIAARSDLDKELCTAV